MSGVTDGIIVGYDGSPGSAEALRWAAREAWARGTVLTICLSWRPGDLALAGDPEAGGQARQRAEQIIARAVGLTQSLLDIAEVRAVLAEGPPAAVLCERSSTAEMVVVGSHGQGQLSGSLLGPVSWQVASHARGRVVVVRGQWRPVNQAPGPVVAGVDGSSASQAALAFAFEEATLRDVPLIAVCSLADAPGRLGAAQQIEEDFSRLMTRYEKEHPEVTVLRQVEFGAPRSALLTAATGAQMLAVGSRGLGGLEGMSLGSVAATLLHHSPCPVTVVHPPGGRLALAPAAMAFHAEDMTEARRLFMQAQVGDELTVKGHHQGDEDQHGEIIEVIGADGAPPYMVRWRDGFESLFFIRPRPGSATAQDGAPDTRGHALLVHHPSSDGTEAPPAR